MADDKIRISWEEVQDPRVDEKLRQQSAQNRAAIHYQQQVAVQSAPGQIAPLSPGSGRRAFWYNSLVYMTMFGLMGGTVAWVVGEGEQWIMRSVLETAGKDADARLEQLQRELENAIAQGRITLETGKADLETSLAQEVSRLKRNLLFFTIAFCALCGGIIAGFLGVAEPMVERNWPLTAFQGSLALLAGLVGGALVGSFINALYEALGGGKADNNMLIQIVARGIGWAILGMFLSVPAGLVLRNFKKCLCGVAGGLIGGLLGGCLFDPITLATHSDVVGRLFGIVAIGALSGLTTGLIENAAKTGWVRVLRGVIAGKQFILYRNPTFVGSSPQCEIYLFKDPSVAPRHAALHIVSGGFELEDLQSGMPTYVNGRPIRRQRLRNEDQVQIGATLFLFQERYQKS